MSRMSLKRVGVRVSCLVQTGRPCCYSDIGVKCTLEATEFDLERNKNAFRKCCNYLDTTQAFVKYIFYGRLDEVCFVDVKTSLSFSAVKVPVTNGKYIMSGRSVACWHETHDLSTDFDTAKPQKLSAYIQVIFLQ